MGLTERELFLSSPESFYYAVEGYYDKEESAMLVMRKVAQCCWQGKPEDFNIFWPLPDSMKQDKVKKSWGTVEEAIEFRNKILEANNKFREQTKNK